MRSKIILGPFHYSEVARATDQAFNLAAKGDFAAAVAVLDQCIESAPENQPVVINTWRTVRELVCLQSELANSLSRIEDMRSEKMVGGIDLDRRIGPVIRQIGETQAELRKFFRFRGP